MAPGTNLGAATPINLGDMPGVPRRNEPSKDEKGSSGTSQQSAAERKAINDVVALLRSLAQLRGRDVDFAEKAVREAATLTADDALKAGVIDAVAVNLDDLLTKLDGRKVTMGGAERTLATKSATVVTVEADLRTHLLSVVSNPNVAFILLMIGFYGIILEFWSPGSFAPGVIGSICLILGLIGLSALPINFGALGLLLLGIALMIAEAFTPGIGVLGIGGVAAFIAGGYFLVEDAGTDIDMSISLPLIVGMAATTALLTFAVVAAAMKSRQRPPASGSEQMIGARAQVVAWEGQTGSIRVHGEIWNARAAAPLQAGDGVRVIGRDGLTLIVDR
jgi:membrane-bound serine protease (ClpP class)